jgi:hypothetical protein
MDKELVSDDLWETIEPLLPPEKRSHEAEVGHEFRQERYSAHAATIKDDDLLRPRVLRSLADE